MQTFVLLKSSSSDLLGCTGSLVALRSRSPRRISRSFCRSSFSLSQSLMPLRLAPFAVTIRVTSSTVDLSRSSSSSLEKTTLTKNGWKKMVKNDLFFFIYLFHHFFANQWWEYISNQNQLARFAKNCTSANCHTISYSKKSIYQTIK